MDNLTLHGLEECQAGRHCSTPTDVDLSITILSLFRRKFALSELIVDRPQLAVQFEKDYSQQFAHTENHLEASHGNRLYLICRIRLARTARRQRALSMTDGSAAHREGPVLLSSTNVLRRSDG